MAPIALAIAFGFAVFWATTGTTTPASLHDFASGIAQFTGILLALTFIGSTINLETPDNVRSAKGFLRSEVKSVSELAERFSIARRNRLDVRMRWIAGRERLSDLVFSGQETDYYIYRPHWDGAWYQVVHSPFRDRPTTDRAIIAVLHEAAICAARSLQIVDEIESTGLALLGPDKGVQGARWFAADFQRWLKPRKKAGGRRSGFVTAQMPLKDAVQLVRLSISSLFYMESEGREYLDEAYVPEERMVQFEIYLREYSKWMAFTVEKIQKLRMNYFMSFATRLPQLQPDAMTDRLGFAFLQDLLDRLRTDSAEAVGRYGIARRRADLKRASTPAIVCSVLIVALLLFSIPFEGAVVGHLGDALVLAIVGALAMLAFVLNARFAFVLLLGRSVETPIPGVGSRPPGR